MQDIYFDFIGVFGVCLSIYSYARLQWQRDYAKRLSYSLLNLIGTIFLMISLFNNWNLAAFISNLAWGAISLYGVYRCTKYMLRMDKSVKPL